MNLRKYYILEIASVVFGFVVVLLVPALSCATTPRSRAKQVAVIQKTVVDGVGNAYLSYCKIVRKPKCIDEDRATRGAGRFPTKEERVACLKPCDSSTAEKVQTGIDVVRTAQSTLFELIRSEDVTEAELDAQRDQLSQASRQLIALLRDHGIMDLLGDAVGGAP